MPVPRSLVVLVLLVASIIPMAARAQAVPAPRFEPYVAVAPAASGPTPAAAVRPRGVVPLAAGGLLGGAVGFFGGALLATRSHCSNEDCQLGQMAVGAAVGTTTLLPLGVHLANGRRGNYGLSLLASAGVALLGMAAGSGGSESLLVLVPVGQLASSILIERATTR